MSAIVEPTRHKLSVDAYERLFTAGVLPEDSRVELIEGDLIDAPFKISVDQLPQLSLSSDPIWQ